MCLAEDYKDCNATQVCTLIVSSQGSDVIQPGSRVAFWEDRQQKVRQNVKLILEASLSLADHRSIGVLLCRSTWHWLLAHHFSHNDRAAGPKDAVHHHRGALGRADAVSIMHLRQDGRNNFGMSRLGARKTRHWPIALTWAKRRNSHFSHRCHF